MSNAKHRGPVHRGLRTHLAVLWTALWTTAAVRRRVTRRTARRVYNAPPAEICRVGLTMADAIAAATTNYPVVEPCPWGLSAGACAAWHPTDHVSRYAGLSA